MEKSEDVTILEGCSTTTPAYYDRGPAGRPAAMGVNVRTARVRHTEWRDCKTGHVVACELYDGVNDPHEMRNAVDLPALAAAQGEAAALRSRQFQIAPH